MGYQKWCKVLAGKPVSVDFYKVKNFKSC